MELDRAKIGFTITTATPLVSGVQIAPFAPQVVVTIEKAIPIREDMTDFDFLRAVDEVDSGVGLVKAATTLILKPTPDGATRQTVSSLPKL